MDEKKAVSLVENLVIATMQAGLFKDFDSLDACREAVAFLKSKYNISQLHSNGQEGKQQDKKRVS